MTKYSDIEKGERRELATEQTEEISIKCSRMEMLWYCMPLIPISLVIWIYVSLASFIMNQLEDRDANNEKVILISNPWINGTTHVRCTSDIPCKSTCQGYREESGIVHNGCEFSYLWIIVAGTILSVSILMTVCECLKYLVGYCCAKDSKKDTTPRRGNV
jgi:hypothetical protein